MVNGRKKYCWTLNNYTDEDVEKLSTMVSDPTTFCVYCVFQKEVAPTTGTPHLQGYSVFSKERTWSHLHKICPRLSSDGKPVKGNHEQNRKYCTKEDSRAPGTEIYEFGELPQVIVSENQGKRTDLVEFRDAVKADPTGWTTVRIVEEFPNVIGNHPQYVRLVLGAYAPAPEVTPDWSIRPWQKELEELLQTEPDNRTWNFVLDRVGNQGKTEFYKYYNNKYPGTSMYMNPGKVADMAHAYDPNIRVLFVNVTRKTQNTLQYGFFESVKDGIVFSPKYESHTKRFKSPHVVFFMNNPPDPFGGSVDRYVIWEINDGMFDKYLWSDIDWTCPNWNPPERESKKRKRNYDSDNE